MFAAKFLALSASLAGIATSSAVAPRQTTAEPPSTTTSVAESETPDLVEGPECTVWYTVNPGDSCTTISIDEHLSLDDIAEFNPELVCYLIYPGDQICIGIEGREPDPSIPQPLLPGTVRTCEEFHLYEGAPWGCRQLMEEYHIPEAEFYAWNAGLTDQCLYLREGFYVCVGDEGFVPDLSRPQPVLPGTAEECEEYHKVVYDETCHTLSVQYDIPLEDFYALNTGIDEVCSNMVSDYYVCVRG